jgi:phosphoglycerate dehydrogenase-like enzyme
VASEKPDATALGAVAVDFGTLLSTSDFVIVLCALTDATRGLINAPALAQLKDGAVLINASRGEVVDQGALVDGAYL